MRRCSSGSGQGLGKFIRAWAMFCLKTVSSSLSILSALSSLSSLIIRTAVATIVLAIVAEGTASAGITPTASTSTASAVIVESASSSSTTTAPATSLRAALLTSLGATGLTGGRIGVGLLRGSLFVGT